MDEIPGANYDHRQVPQGREEEVDEADVPQTSRAVVEVVLEAVVVGRRRIQSTMSAMSGASHMM